MEISTWRLAFCRPPDCAELVRMESSAHHPRVLHRTYLMSLWDPTAACMSKNPGLMKCFAFGRADALAGSPEMDWKGIAAMEAGRRMPACTLSSRVWLSQVTAEFILPTTTKYGTWTLPALLRQLLAVAFTVVILLQLLRLLLPPSVWTTRQR